ncbi:MFS transporter [Micromonospora globbae]|uniref:MFS transporter n=1 Tax=Micromonospora globbae TaxID=1894969 RepID=UPI00343763EE
MTNRDAAPSSLKQPLGPPFWRLWFSSGVSNLADGIFKVALPLVAIQFTRSPALIAGLAALLTLPWLILALPAGALSDRLDRRRIMLVANVARASLLAVLVLVLMLDAGSVWVLAVVALCIGINETVYDTAAQSILPQLVTRDQLSRANGRLYGAELTANQFIGPPLGGILAVVGAAAAFAAPAALWAVAVAALLLVRGDFRVVREQRTTLRADIGEGLRFLFGHRLLRTLAAMVGLFNLGANSMFAVLVLYAVGPTSAMHLSEQAFGVLLTTIAAGSLAGSMVAERVERLLGRAATIAVAYLSGALLLGIPALTTNPFLIGASFFTGGMGMVVANIVTVSLRQRITPNRLLGRVNSAYRLIAWGTMPIGALLGGLLAQLFGLRAVFAITGLLAVATLAGLTIVSNDRMDAAEREAEQQSGPRAQDAEDDHRPQRQDAEQAS